MSDAFRESNTNTYRNVVTFVSGFGVIADQAFQVGSSTTTSSNLITYNIIVPWGGISGYLPTGTLINSNHFVKTTGDQNISGVKNFFFSPKTNAVISNGNNATDVAMIDLVNQQLWNNAFELSLDWAVRQLSDGANVSVDWTNRILSGTWNVQALRMSGVSVATGAGGGGGGGDFGAYNLVYTTGNQNVNNLKTFSGAIFSGYFSGINLTGWNITARNYIASDKIYATTLSDSYIDVLNNTMYNSAPAVSLNWDSAILYADGSPTLYWATQMIVGNWLITGLNALQTLKISGQSVITGGHIPTRFYTGRTTGPLNEFTLDWASGSTFNYTMSGHTKFNFVNDKDGQTIVFGLANTGNVAGAAGNGMYTGIWPTNIRWPYNTPPLQTTGSIAYIDIYTFVRMGTGIYGNVVPAFTKF